ncbi:hypothetical protein IU459_15090 [Nocardia amamiensis]|uniref:Ig-like domain-containing protein n=1 Tax=Nocardia amamiensis TaxID=404578 RepID=A0ABS0CVJ4_9NOCA|nr:hypothetical protein [Nocardia amamiensis]
MIKLDDADSTLVWFHLSDARGDLDIATIAEGLPVEVEIEPIPQGEYTCRAKSVHRRN